MKFKIPVYLLVLLSLINIVYAQSMVCYQEIESGQTITVCEVESAYNESNDYNWNLDLVKIGSYIELAGYDPNLYRVQTSSYIELANYDPNLYRLQASSYLERQQATFPQFLYTSSFSEQASRTLPGLLFSSEKVEAQLNPRYKIAYQILEEGQILIQTTEFLLGDTELKYKVRFPKLSQPNRMFLVEYYIDNNKITQKTFSSEYNGKEIEDIIYVTILEKKDYRVNITLYLLDPIDRKTTYYSSDYKIIPAKFEPFEIIIEKPERGSTVNSTLVRIEYLLKIPPTRGIRYYLETLLEINGRTTSFTDTIPPGIIGKYTYTVDFGSEGEAKIKTRITAIYTQTNYFISQIEDETTFVIRLEQPPTQPPAQEQPPTQEQQPTQPPTYQPPSIVSPPTLEVITNITQPVTNVTQPSPQPQGVQVVIEYIRGNILIVLVLVGLILALAMMLLRRR